jgi:hypothetical protein
MMHNDDAAAIAAPTAYNKREQGPSLALRHPHWLERSPVISDRPATSRGNTNWHQERGLVRQGCDVDGRVIG